MFVLWVRVCLVRFVRVVRFAPVLSGTTWSLPQLLRHHCLPRPDIVTARWGVGKVSGHVCFVLLVVAEIRPRVDVATGTQMKQTRSPFVPGALSAPASKWAPRTYTWPSPRHGHGRGHWSCHVWHKVVWGLLNVAAIDCHVGVWNPKWVCQFAGGAMALCLKKPAAKARVECYTGAPVSVLDHARQLACGGRRTTLPRHWRPKGERSEPQLFYCQRKPSRFLPDPSGASPGTTYGRSLSRCGCSRFLFFFGHLVGRCGQV